MTNLELVVSVLAAHREARRWADEAVAEDILAQLGIGAGEMVVSELSPEQEATPQPPQEGEPGAHPDIETKHYSDGTIATGPGPLPGMSPSEQDAHDDAERTADYKDQLDAALNPSP